MRNRQILLVFIVLIFKTNSENYNRFKRIIGGYRRENELNLAKHIVSIRIGHDFGIYGSNHMCAGSIISSHLILTAGHCVHNSKNGKILNKNLFTIVAGNAHRLKPSKSERSYKVEKIISYPKYNYSLSLGDLAVMKITEDFKEDNVSIQRIALSNEEPKPGMRCVALGWGKISFNGPAPDELVYMNVTILPIVDCLAFVPITVGIICAGELEFLEKTAGTGDSGGPLICNGKLEGIISFIIPVRTYLSSVWYYRDWIIQSDACVNNLHRQLVVVFNLLLLRLMYWYSHLKIIALFSFP